HKKDLLSRRRAGKGKQAQKSRERVTKTPLPGLSPQGTARQLIRFSSTNTGVQNPFPASKKYVCDRNSADHIHSGGTFPFLHFSFSIAQFPGKCKSFSPSAFPNS